MSSEDPPNYRLSACGDVLGAGEVQRWSLTETRLDEILEWEILEWDFATLRGHKQKKGWCDTVKFDDTLNITVDL